MALVLYTNVASLQARSALSRTENATASTMARLSSGLRIHSAKDDAAGLAVSSRIEAQWRGTDQAARNANDGISLLQVGDQALGSMTDQLQRLRDLAVQSLNGTLSDADRKSLDADLQQGLAEVDRTASNTTFNGRSLLDGGYGNALFQVGAGSQDGLAIDLSTSVRTDHLGAIAKATSTDLRTSGGGFQFAGTYTTAAIGSLDFSRPAVPFTPGYTATAAAPPTNYSGAGNATTFSVDGRAVTLNQNYLTAGAMALAVQGQLDTSAPGAYVANIDSNGHLRVTKNQSATWPSAAPVIAGTSGAFASAFNGATQTNGTVPTPTTNAGFDVDGHAVSLTGNYADANGLIADIQSQLDQGASGTYRVTGSTSGISIEHLNGGNLPVLDHYTGAGAAVFGQRAAANLTLHAGDLTVQVGNGRQVDVTGTFATPDDLARAVTAQVGDVVTHIDAAHGTLEISARQTITIGGTQGGSGGSVGFTPAVNAPSGHLSGIDIKTADGARDAVLRLDASLDEVTTQRGAFGAATARLQAVVDQDTQDGSILRAAHGRIVDADMAVESAAFARNQVLQQAGVAMVAQANARSQDVMALLR